MGRQCGRPPKKPRVDPPRREDPHSPRAAVLRIPQNTSPPPHPRQAKESRVALAKRAQLKRDQAHNTTTRTSDQDIQNFLGFCCWNCNCPEDELPPGDDGKVHKYIQSGENGLYHRCCCHGVTTLENINDWATHYEVAEEEIGEHFDVDNHHRWVPYREIYDNYETAKSLESALYNSDCEAHPLSLLMTNQEYLDRVVKPYHQRRQQYVITPESDRKGVVVLDAFAGIGTGTLALKRLGIDIAKIIHVEHDKVATHVYQWNHNREYNQSLPEDDDDNIIQHILINKWEDFQSNWRDICEKYDFIDVILATPPGLVSGKGRKRKLEYILRLGHLTQEIEKYQKRPIYFLVETKFVSGDDLAQIRKAFGLDWDPIPLDALYFSPLRRNRHYFTNIPCPDIKFDSEASLIGPATCLEEGFFAPAQVVDPDVLAKAPSLSACHSRVDEFQTLRMFVFKHERDECNRYFGRPMTLTEREKLMGYPVGYIHDSVEELFTSLVKNALCRKFQSDLPPWKAILPERYHTFGGNYHALKCKNVHRFEVRSSDPPFVFLQLAPPGNSRKPRFFNADEYGKRLIGMGSSLPVLCALLEPLQKIYPRKQHARFQYSYAWEESKTGDVASTVIDELLQNRSKTNEIAPTTTTRQDGGECENDDVSLFSDNDDNEAQVENTSPFINQEQIRSEMVVGDDFTLEISQQRLGSEIKVSEIVVRGAVEDETETDAGIHQASRERQRNEDTISERVVQDEVRAAAAHMDSISGDELEHEGNSAGFVNQQQVKQEMGAYEQDSQEVMREVQRNESVAQIEITTDEGFMNSFNDGDGEIAYQGTSAGCVKQEQMKAETVAQDVDPTESTKQDQIAPEEPYTASIPDDQIKQEDTTR